MKKKIVIGTAQFGNIYGISNVKKINLNPKEIKKILKFCNENNLNYLDTAMDYGNSQSLIGNINNNFQIFTKISLLKINKNNLKKTINLKINHSLLCLKKKNIHTLFIHNFDEIIKNKSISKLVFLELNKFKKKNIIKFIGVSSYYPEKLHKYHKFFKFDSIQVPLNLFDQRLIKSKIFKSKKFANIQIHVRSIFLQGLLLFNKKTLPTYFLKWKRYFLFYFKFLKSKNINSLDASLKFIKQFDRINFIVIGVQKTSELKEILLAYKKLKKVKNKFKFPLVKSLINPSNWKI